MNQAAFILAFLMVVKAPDLGRRLDRDYTPTGIAARMWSHAPAMWAAMGQESISISQVTAPILLIQHMWESSDANAQCSGGSTHRVATDLLARTD